MWRTTPYSMCRSSIASAYRDARARLERGMGSKSTVDSSEVEHFERLTADWWNENGHVRALHALNKVRVPLIRDGILYANGFDFIKHNPLKGAKILDVGCGGGILSEPLARLGGTVIGLDPNSAVLERATSRSEKQDLKIKYLNESVEDFARANKDKIDAVVASEILEHVTNKQEFLKACIECLKPGGSIFITTINKTFTANFLGIMMAEHVLGLLPTGTHQYEKFISPEHLQTMLWELDTKTVLLQGLAYSFLKNEWKWAQDFSINYALHGIKKEQPKEEEC